MESGKFIEKRKNNIGAQILTGAGIVGAVGVADALDGKIDGFGLFAKSNTTNTPNEPPKSAGQSVPPQSSETAVPPVTNSSSETSSTNSEVVPTSIYDLSSGPITINFDKFETKSIRDYIEEFTEQNPSLVVDGVSVMLAELELIRNEGMWDVMIQGYFDKDEEKFLRQWLSDDEPNTRLISTIQDIETNEKLVRILDDYLGNIDVDPSVEIDNLKSLLNELHQNTSGTLVNSFYISEDSVDSHISPHETGYHLSFQDWDQDKLKEIFEYVQTLKHPISFQNYNHFFNDIGNPWSGYDLRHIDYNDFIVQDVDGSNINPDIGDGVKDFFQKYIQDISKLDKDGDEKLIWSESYITREGDNYILKTTDNFDDNEISLIEFSNLTPEAIEYLESEFMSQEEYNSQLGIEDDSKNSDTTLLPDPVLDTEWNEEYVLYLNRFEYLWRKLTDDSNNNGISDSTGKILYSPKVGIPVELYSEHLELNSENSFLEDWPTLLINRPGYEDFIANDPDKSTIYNENFVEVPETLELYVSKIGEIGGNFDENGKFIYHPDLAEFGVYLDYNDDGFCDFSPEVKIPEGSYTVTGEEIYYHN